MKFKQLRFKSIQSFYIINTILIIRKFSSLNGFNNSSCYFFLVKDFIQASSMAITEIALSWHSHKEFCKRFFTRFRADVLKLLPFFGAMWILFRLLIKIFSLGLGSLVQLLHGISSKNISCLLTLVFSQSTFWLLIQLAHKTQASQIVLQCFQCPPFTFQKFSIIFFQKISRNDFEYHHFIFLYLVLLLFQCVEKDYACFERIRWS